MALEPLIDGHGRGIADLRLSVTDRCNFRCQYCMPADGLPWLEREAVLRFEEIERIVALVAQMGIDSVRLTGGEPLVRRDFPRLAAMLAPLVEDLSVTTNGYLLERDAAALVDAGINRFNVSIDSLQRDRFFAMTRRDALPQVLRGLEALAAHPEAHPIKVNAVALRGFTEQEVLPFARFAREHPYEVRFIEFMPLDGDRSWTRDQVLTGEEIRAADPRRRTRWSPSRASPARRRASAASPTAPGGSASSTPSPSRSARLRPHPADRRRQAAHMPVLAQRDRPARAAARPARPTTSSSRSCATPSGARSSSTTSTSRASSSPLAR